MEWILIASEVPGHGQEVIAYAPNGKRQTPELIKQCTYASGHWYFGDHSSDMDGVTHWMPMPEAPNT